MSRKKIELNLDYNKIMGRINACKAEIYPEKKTDNKKWAALVGVSESLVSQLHPKKQNTKTKEPSLEYILAVARVTGKSIEWYLYGENWDRAESAAPAANPAKDFPPAHWPEEMRRACRQMQKIFLSDYDHDVIKPALMATLAAYEASIDNELLHTTEIKELQERLHILEETISGGKNTNSGEGA